MSPFSEIRLIVQRELRKNLRSVKGIILFAISLLGASVTMFNLKAFEVEAPLRFKDATPELIREAKAAAIQEFFYSDGEVANHLADAPLKLVLIFFLAVWLAPMLVALLGFDTVSSDMQYRSVRYWTVRVRRGSFLIGKFFGMWAVVASVTFVMHLLVWIVTLVKGEASFGATMSWGLRFWLFSLPVSAIWCGLATFFGSLFKTPILSLLVICLVFALIFFFGFGIDAIIRAGSQGSERVEWLTRLYPNSYDAWLASPKGTRAGQGLLVCVAYAALPVALASFLFQRRDI